MRRISTSGRRPCRTPSWGESPHGHPRLRAAMPRALRMLADSADNWACHVYTWHVLAASSISEGHRPDAAGAEDLRLSVTQADVAAVQHRRLRRQAGRDGAHALHPARPGLQPVQSGPLVRSTSRPRSPAVQTLRASPNLQAHHRIMLSHLTPKVRALPCVLKASLCRAGESMSWATGSGSTTRSTGARLVLHLRLALL